jgi:hypothetical protein
LSLSLNWKVCSYASRECNSSGPADITLYETHYVEGGEKVNWVPNANFKRGYNGWGAWGKASWKLKSSGRSYALHVTAKPDQDAAINSTRFAVTAGAEFTVTVVARVSPKSQGSGYFCIMFHDADRELRRFMIPIKPADILLSEAVTDSNGAYHLQLSEAPPPTVALKAWYSGDDAHWPAFASKLLTRD